MFRIDKEYVSYGREGKLDEVYTTIHTPPPVVEEIVGEALQEEARLALAQAEAKAEGRLIRAEQEAGEILARAKAGAEGILKAAEAESEAALAAARDRGYAEGLKAGKREAEARCETEIALIQGLLQKIENERNAVMDSLEGEIIELVLKISEKVVNVQLEKDDKTFVELMRGAMDRLKSGGRVSLRVSQEEYERFFATGLGQQLLDPQGNRISPVSEALFKRWDCVLENEEETLDAGVSGQLKRISLALRGQVGL